MGEAPHSVPVVPVRANGVGEQRTTNDLTQLLRDWLAGMKFASSLPGEESSARRSDIADDARKAVRLVF